MANVLIFGDSKYPALRQEVPLPLPDPIAYVESDGRRSIVAGSLDVPRMEALGGYEVISFEELGLNELLAGGAALSDAHRELVGRVCDRLGVTEAAVPGDFPFDLADFLRTKGIGLRPDAAMFELRRRSKAPAQIEGIRRAMRAAELAMAHVRAGLRQAADQTAEELRAGARRIFVENGTMPHEMLVIAAGAAGADPHDEGAGPIPSGVPIVVGIFPRDMASGCWGDITRTFCVGEPPAELVEWHRLVREAQLRATEAVRPGISGEVPYAAACEVLEAEILMPGDVVTVEPGLYRPGFGGCRIEDVVLVTEDGFELLTDFPYDLEP